MDPFPVIGPSLALDLGILSNLSSRIRPNFGGGDHGDSSAVRLAMEKRKSKGLKLLSIYMCLGLYWAFIHTILFLFNVLIFY